MARRSSARRRKRKRRAGERGGPGARGAEAAAPSRSDRRDAAARAALVPLAEGERPLAVTVAAVVAGLLGVANIALYAAGLEIGDERPSAVGVIAYSLLMLVAAWGMWRSRYWAVLGMEALLGLVILIFSLVAIRAENTGDVLIAAAVIGACGTLFWFLIKAMARIQMPQRR